MGDKYWFPNMKIPEITAALRDWGLPVSPEQLIRPSSEFVMSIYNACLEQVTDLNYQTLQEPTQSALNFLDDPNPDLYAVSLSENILLYHMTRFAAAARIPNFNSRDIYFPEPERTHGILSAFINFVKFAEQCQPFVLRLRERSNKATEEREEVINELADLQAKLEALKTQRAEDEPRCEVLRRENAAITAHLMATKEMQGVLLEDIATLKVEKAGVLRRKEHLNSETVAATDSITRTRSRIVQSPERIKRSIITMGGTAIEDKRTVAVHEAKARDLQAKVTALFNIEKREASRIFEHVSEQLQTIEKEVNSLETSQKELADLKDHLDSKKIERSELQMKQDRVRKQLLNAQEKLERAQKHAEDKRLASHQTIERLQREYEEMSLERRDNDKQMEQLREEADEVAAKMAEHKKKSEAELSELLTEYWKLRHETEVYMEILASKLKLKVSAE